MILKFALFLCFIIELTIIIWEIVLNRRMRKLKIKGFEKKTEEDRRRDSYKIGYLGLTSVVLWFVILIVVLAAEPGRECDAAHAMEMAVCVPCAEPLCEQCHDNSQFCEKCPAKYNSTALFNSQDGRCMKCDVGCSACVDGGGGAITCTACEAGFYLSQAKYCRTCKTGCLECSDRDASTGEQQCDKCVSDKMYISKKDFQCHSCNEGCAECSDDEQGNQMCSQCQPEWFLR